MHRKLAVPPSVYLDTKFYGEELSRLRNPLAKLYFAVGMFARSVVYSTPFTWAVAGVICIAGLLVGLQTDGLIAEGTESLESGIFAVFLLECVLKIVAEIFQPLRFFRWIYSRPWTCSRPLSTA